MTESECLPVAPDAGFAHLRSQRSSHLLNQIEKIRANGVGELVSLPQLVVCGDQSAGKSSVLEGITGMPFPRQEGLCTRFPTEIVLRHSNTPQTITATIRPHGSRTQEVQKTLRGFQKSMQHMTELPSIIGEAAKLMGIRGYSEFADDTAFASDALHIEISGPIGMHLSVVDLPGLISVPNEEQTDEDLQTVYDMVEDYIQSSRTVILAVLQASNDMANQGIIKLARRHDPEGQRTVGIITKPDLINEGTESRIALVARNLDTIKLKLNFFLLKNPSPKELREGLDMDSRYKRELRFFSAPAWANQKLDMNRVGAENLRRFLQALLDTHIERELPKVRDEIKGKLIETERELSSMGQARPTIGDIRAFLTSVSMRFYELAKAALEGNYHSLDPEFFSDDDISRLRAHVQKSNTKFASQIREQGQKRKISEAVDSDDSESMDGTTDQLLVSKSEMMAWVEQVYERTRGTELPGNYNPVLLAELYREQSQPWITMAKKHVQNTVVMTRQWVRSAGSRLIREEGLRGEVEVIFDQWLSGAESQALEELNKLVADEQRHPLTYNHYYTDNVQKSRQDAQKRALRRALNLVTEEDWNGKLHISNNRLDIDRFVSALEARITVDMDKQACSEALNELNAYYKVAMKTFVDNVTRQVIERHIMFPLPNAFCPQVVSQYPDDILVRIGSEPEQQVLRRTVLKQLVDGLKRSLDDLQRLPSQF